MGGKHQTQGLLCTRIGALGLLDGLKLAWNLGAKRLQVEGDSKVAMEMASDRTVEGVSSIVKEIRDLLDQDLLIEFKHIFSESNFAADFMAKMAVSLAVGLHVHIKPPMSILPVSDHDTMSCSKKSVHCS
ncbi:hypothetical protein J1N35_039693 [Gossypium stocksii]|uniref:RNase H type-1 domain-containing protein n=1 Tax=Gossypium stocksii TaxID=47602 RepID=A0A9D3UC76_9ROSI|nr:hypothetical protein J1N35_039693 [Gossypium stocksii]